MKQDPSINLLPKAQGEVENFNKLINKIAAIAKQDHINFTKRHTICFKPIGVHQIQRLKAHHTNC